MSDAAHAPILEYDPEREALVNPGRRPAPRPGQPAAAVACFFPDLLAELCAGAEVVLDAPFLSPIWKLDWKDTPIFVFFPGLGAPAAAHTLELVISMGAGSVVACGGAGALVPLDLGALVVVDAAVRDEGTSYHYLPPSREVVADPDVVAHLSREAESHGANWQVGKTWTSDAFYRETPARLARRLEEGCIVVDQEASALIAIAQFRGIRFGQYLFAGDDLFSGSWDHRDWWSELDAHHALFALAADAAIGLDPP